LGALLAWEYIELHAEREGLRHFVLVLVLLFALNLVLWWAVDGQLAWQTHLGGFLAGWVAAFFLDDRPLIESGEK